MDGENYIPERKKNNFLTILKKSDANARSEWNLFDNKIEFNSINDTLVGSSTIQSIPFQFEPLISIFLFVNIKRKNTPKNKNY